jgi:hypothetical protein
LQKELKDNVEEIYIKDRGMGKGEEQRDGRKE